MTSAEMSEEQRSVLKRVEKLMRLADGVGSVEEKASAARKVQDLLLAYNLDAAAIGSSEDGRRMQEKLRGGFYRYERSLWRAVADLNFCLYWGSTDYVERPEADRRRRKVRERYSEFARDYRKEWRHHLVGKRVSVVTCQFMISYLKDAIERLTRDFVSGGLSRSAEDTVVGLGAALRSKRACDYRDGLADNIVSRLWDRRRDQEVEERRRQRAAEALARNAARGATSSSTAVTISSVRQTERDANLDVVHGEGWSARQRAEQAARAAARRAADEEYTRWAAAHPEEAAKQEAERRREERGATKRRSGGRGSRGGRVGRDRDWGAYYAGQDDGSAIGLDPQAEHASAPRKIAGRV